MSFAEITDLRALEIEQLHESSGLPILVNWSGGIDSTCIVAAIYKVCKPSTIKNTTIRLNNSSYFENPKFFRDIIKPNFNYTEVERSGFVDAEYIFVTGDPADQLWIHADIIELLYKFPGQSKNNVNTNPDTLLKFLETKTDPAHARWFYTFILQSSTRSPVPVVTYEDFYWWANYNFYYCGNSFKAYLLDYAEHCTERYAIFKKTCVPWYTSNNYQQWSLHNNSNGVKLGNSIASYKEPAKKYIVDVDKNYHYYYYKSKVGGISMPTIYAVGDIYRDPDTIVAAYNDGTILRMSELHRVQELFCSNQQILK
ncbi:hypothetical protein [Flavobacterium sp.]|uniref:hypothetical protein n=1 Tax=Flavobacterium sp. TaxID=239 RepID=UPI0037BEA123